jgi:nitrite reductase/ring-hydroxylating ferredoxin subunit
VTTDGREATYTLFDHDSPIVLSHHGTEFTVRSGEPVTAPVPPPPPAPEVSQPPGREPLLQSG